MELKYFTTITYCSVYALVERSRLQALPRQRGLRAHLLGLSCLLKYNKKTRSSVTLLA